MGSLASRYEVQSFSFIQTDDVERNLPLELTVREGMIPSLAHIRKRVFFFFPTSQSATCRTVVRIHFLALYSRRELGRKTDTRCRDHDRQQNLSGKWLDESETRREARRAYKMTVKIAICAGRDVRA